MSLLKEIKEQLRTEYPGVNLSNKKIEAIALKVDKRVTEESQIKDVLTDLNDLYPFDEMARDDDRDRLRLAKEEKEKQPTPQVVTPTPDLAEPDNTPDGLLKQLIEQNKLLFGEIASIKGEKVVNSRKQAAQERFKDIPKEFVDDLLADMDDINFRDDDHVASYLERKDVIAGAYVQAKSNAGLGGDKIVAGMGKPSSNEKEVSFEMKELIAERTAKAEAKALQN